jgi:hypothetical protein
VSLTRRLGEVAVRDSHSKIPELLVITPCIVLDGGGTIEKVGMRVGLTKDEEWGVLAGGRNIIEKKITTPISKPTTNNTKPFFIYVL